METDENFRGCDKCSSKGSLCEDCIHNPILMDNYSPLEDEDEDDDDDISLDELY